MRLDIRPGQAIKNGEEILGRISR
ncbi:hypothetical protein [Bacteroides heparinolyticus]